MSLDLDLNYSEFNLKMDKSSNNKIYRFGEFKLDASHLMLSRNGDEIPLAPKAVETLLVLVEQRGKILSKSELMDAIWTDSIVEESNLAQYLHKLRKTLGNNADGKPFIETLRRRGYRFNGEVTLTANSTTSAAAAKLTESYTENPVTVAENPKQRLLRVERSENIYSVVDWRQDREGDIPAVRRSALSLPIILVMAAVGLSAFGFALYSLSSDASTQRTATAAPFGGKVVERITSSGKTKRAAISPDGRYVAHITEDADGSNLWIRHVSAPSDIRIAGSSPSEFVWVGFGNDGDNVFYLSLDRDKGVTELLRVPVLGGPSVRAANDTGPVGFSPDGRSIAFFRFLKDESRLIIASTDGSNERVVTSRREPDYFKIIWNAPAWSPDGKTIACPVRITDGTGSYETLIGFEIETGSERAFTATRWQQVGQPKWHSNSIVVTAAEQKTGPRQIWHIALSDGVATRLTHDLNDYSDLSVTADGSKLAAVQNHVVSSFHLSSSNDEAEAKQIASEVGWLDNLAWTPDSRIAYISNAGGSGEIWIMNADGTNSRQLTSGAIASRGLAVTPDGRHVVFSSERGGQSNLWRVGIDGADLTQLTTGTDEFCPQFTPDGNWIVFQRGEFDPTIWKIPANGGDSIQLGAKRGARPVVSADGKFAAYRYLDSSFDRSRWSIGISPLDGGAQMVRFDFPSTVIQRFIRFTPDGRSIAFLNTSGGESELWAQPLSGEHPYRLMGLRASNVLAFEWSPDGRSFAMIDCVETSDVVLMNNVPPAVTK